jgi:uncharacterized protein (TIGR03437 family)
VAAWAQAPEIARNGVVNEASNTPLALADSAIARGARLTIRGAHFGAHPSDTSATLSGPAGDKALAIIKADPSTVIARVPADAPLGAASLTVKVNGRSSLPYLVKVVRAQFGIYANNGKGWGPGRIQNVTGTARLPNTVSSAATFGQTLALSGTGLGDEKTPAVFVGGRPAKVVATRASPDGDEILFQVPANAPEGCFVPVQIQNTGRLASNTVTVALHKGGGACRQPEYFPFGGWLGARFGMVAITRTTQRKSGAAPVSDETGAWFGQLPGMDRMNPYFLLPPPGTCTSEAEPWRGGFVPATLISLLASRAGAEALRAGDEISIDDGRTVRKVPAFHGMEGVFDRELSDLAGRPDRLLHFVSPAVLHVTGKGGPDVGRFRFELGGPQPFEMRGEMGPVRRGQMLRLGWTDMGAGRIAIVFANFVDEATGSRGMCYCVAAPGATGLTIPASTLACFPPDGARARIALTVAAWPLRPVAFQAPGLDHALAVSAYMQHYSTGPNPSTFRERN